MPSLPPAEVVSIRERLLTCLYETYTKTRIEQLFEIIIEFPESQPALEDLRDCLAQTEGLRTLLTSSLRQVLDAKLLHPGVNTADILTAYISVIRALKSSGQQWRRAGAGVQQCEEVPQDQGGHCAVHCAVAD